MLLSGACVLKDRLDLSSAAGIKLTSGQMPVVQAILNGRCFLCLVNTGSERTLVSPRVVKSQGLQPGRPLLTANGNASHVRGMCRVIIGLQGHCFCVTALVMSELDNLGVDCLLGGDAIDYMGGVTVGRDPESKYSVTWRRVSSAGCCDLPRWKYASQRVTRDTASVAVVSNDCKTGSLRVEDPDFVAVFSKGRWTVSWR